jgi:hypothetical protein
MKDETSKRKGLPYSTSRKQEKAFKRNTIKARRQDGKKQIRKDMVSPE